MSYFQKSVSLKEWWLVKADKDYNGMRLAVAGITSGEKQAVRFFSSAPILKRYDLFTVETVDGICVIVQGFINKTLTQENGFPSEICEHFVFGFPPSWEIFSRKCAEGDLAPKGDAQSNSGFERLSPQAASSSKTKNFDKATCESETHECGKKKNLEVKSVSENGEKVTKHNPGCEKTIPAFDSKACTGPERETSFGDYLVKDLDNFVLSGSHFNIISAKSPMPSGLEKNSDMASVKGFVNVTESENYIGKKDNLKNLQEQCSNSPLLACRLTSERECSNSLQSAKLPCQVNSIKKLAKQIVFSRETDLLEEPSCCSEGRGMLCSPKKVQRKSKNNQMSCTKMKDKRRLSVSALNCSGPVGNPRVNLDDRPRGESTMNTPGDEFQEPIDQLASRNADARFFEDAVELDCGVCLASKDTERDEAHGSVQANGIEQNESGDNEKGKEGSNKRSNSQSESFIQRKSMRKSLCNSKGEDLSKRKSNRKMDGLISEKEKSLEDVVKLDCGVSSASKDTEPSEAHVQANGTEQTESEVYRKKESNRRSNSQGESFIQRKSRRKSLCNSEGEDLSKRKSTRNMDGLTSEKEKAESSIMSPESLCLKKSRAGRWLLPSLEFWRNQRVIYDADHQIRGITDLG